MLVTENTYQKYIFAEKMARCHEH